MASSTILKAKVSFQYQRPDGSQGYVSAGSTYHKDSAQLDGLGADALEANFVPFEPDFGAAKKTEERPVERATAKPGEKRETKKAE